MPLSRPSTPSRLSRWLSSRWLRPLNDWDAIEDLLSPLDLTWSASRIRARVVATQLEAPDVLSVVLQPNALWPGFRAGQHVQLEAEINGRVLRRYYSLTSLPGDHHRVRITAKRQSEGKVSNWLHDHLRPGAIVTLGAPQGDFVLPEGMSEPLLMIAAGSGITPLFGMLADLHARGFRGDVVLLQVCQSVGHAIFASELQALAVDWPALRVVPVYTQAGRPTVADLLAQVPDYERRLSLVCAPDALLRALRSHWEERGLGDRLRSERFGTFALAPPGTVQLPVRCLASSVVFSASVGQPLLAQAEHAGLSPRYGCRIGICHTCRYRKRSGVALNLLTGVQSAEPDEMIQLCISSACSELEFSDL